MADLMLLLPDFVLIALGFVLCRYTPLDQALWQAVERLVYFVLFPMLLFFAIAKAPLQPGAVLPLAGAGVGLAVLGVVLAYALVRLPGVDAKLHASGAQVAFRFNTYIALAMAERLAGADGVAWMALLVALCVPLCNVAAVWPLARHGEQGYLMALVRNPLILATVGGLAFNLAGLTLPELLATTLQRVGSAALPLGLMAVGAGLRLGALRASPGLAAGLLGIRHAVLPLAGVALALGLNLPPAQQAVLVLWASVPTATSAYVLAVRMGGHGAFVAGLVTLSTLLALPVMPAALALLAALR